MYRVTQQRPLTLAKYANAFGRMWSFRFASTTDVKPKTGILMMNLGGPIKSDMAAQFMYNMFTDKQTVPGLAKFPRWFIKWFCERRADKSVKKKYDEIGGGTPLYDWTHKQGSKMCDVLDKISPQSAPHKYYIAFRYSQPNVFDAVDECIKDGVEHMIGFSQYPQFSCSTTNSSIQEFSKAIESKEISSIKKISLIDRWFDHEGYINTLARLIAEDINLKFPSQANDQMLILFTAHSLPQIFVDKGDTYPYEINITANSVMEILKEKYNINCCFRVVWQSRIRGKWLSPSLVDTVKNLDKTNFKHVIISPLGFTSDHIETLHELDIELMELAKEKGILKQTEIVRARSLNDEPDFIQSLADIVKQHIANDSFTSKQLLLRCPACTNPDCHKLSSFYKSK